MTWRWIVAGLVLSVVAGCSSTDPIQSANLNVPVVASILPAYGGPYQWARLQVDQITLRPLDEQANAYLAIPLGLLRSFAPVDARSTTTLTIATTPLRAGTYRLEAIRISQIQLNVFNTAPEAPSACCVINDPPQATDCDPAVTNLRTARVGTAIVVEFDDPPILQVLQDGSTQVQVRVDGPALVDMLLDQPYACGAGAFPTPTADQLAQVVTVTTVN